jgi:ABC-type multidrug transport system ATPase subunit
MKQELEWVRQNPKARQAKSKARLSRFEELSSVEYQKRNETQEIFIPVGERLGSKVIEFREVSKSFGDRLLIDKLSFNVPPGAIVGIIGPNGAGKSTLFRMLIGQEQPDSGEIEIGNTVKLAYVDQSRDCLDGDKTVFEEISGGAEVLTVGKYETPARAYIGRFNFKGGDQQKRVGQLSGGERGRLHMAKTLIAGGNVLLLDEPSNDLDVETLRALEDALLEFAGSVLVISHDRWFLDRICTHILACEGDSQWTFFSGNYHEYEEDKKRRLGEEARSRSGFATSRSRARVRMRRFTGHPGQIPGAHFVGQQGRMGVPLYDVEDVFGDILAGHEPGVMVTAVAAPAALDTANVQTLALADGVVGHPIVFAKHAVVVETTNFTLAARQITHQEILERSLTDEADAGRILFECDMQTSRLGNPANFPLVQAGQGE